MLDKIFDSTDTLERNLKAHSQNFATFANQINKMILLLEAEKNPNHPELSRFVSKLRDFGKLNLQVSEKLSSAANVLYQWQANISGIATPSGKTLKISRDEPITLGPKVVSASPNKNWDIDEFYAQQKARKEAEEQAKDAEEPAKKSYNAVPVRDLGLEPTCTICRRTFSDRQPKMCPACGGNLSTSS